MESLEQILARKQAWKKTERKRTAKALNEVRNILNDFDRKPKAYQIPLWVPIVIVATILVLIFTSTGHAYTDKQIVDAIYLVEGGKNAKFPYGIRSVRVSSVAEARQVCFNTVRNNKKRFAKRKHNKNQDYIAYLSSVYCPLNAGNDPKGLNRHWEKNVRYFLKKGES